MSRCVLKKSNGAERNHVPTNVLRCFDHEANPEALQGKDEQNGKKVRVDLKKCRDGFDANVPTQVLHALSISRLPAD